MHVVSLLPPVGKEWKLKRVVHRMSKCQSSSNWNRFIAMMALKSLLICTVPLLVVYLMVRTCRPEEFNEVQDIFHSRTLESNVQCLESIPGNRRITLMGDSRVRQLFFSFVQVNHWIKGPNPRGCSLKKILSHPPSPPKNPKNPKKIRKI